MGINITTEITDLRISIDLKNELNKIFNNLDLGVKELVLLKAGINFIDKSEKMEEFLTFSVDGLVIKFNDYSYTHENSMTNGLEYNLIKTPNTTDEEYNTALQIFILTFIENHIKKIGYYIKKNK